MNKVACLFLNTGLVVLIVIAALIPCTAVCAEDTGETALEEVTDPGILPDSGFYFMKRLGRGLQLAFAGSEAARAKLMLKYSNEDALALKIMYEKGKYDVGARHAEQYASQLEGAVQEIEKVRLQQGKQASEELAAQLEQNYLRQQEVLLSVLEKAPEAAQNGLLNAIEKSNKHVSAMVKAQKGEQALQQYQEQVNEQTKNMGQETRIMVQQKLETTHGQATQAGEMNQTRTRAATDNQTAPQTMQQGGQQNMPNPGAGSTIEPGNAGQNAGQKKQGK